MAEGFITRKGGVAATKAPSLNFVSKTDSEIVFTITNNDDATVDVFWEVGDTTPDANQIELTAGQTSSNQTASGLTQNTQYTIFAFANKAGKAVSDTVSLTQTTDEVIYIEATGGTTTTYEDNGKFYKSHTFTSSSTFIVNSLSDKTELNNLDYLIVGGGASGGGPAFSGYPAGGGGAGGYRTSLGLSGGNTSAESKITATVQNYGIVIGAGGGIQTTFNQQGNDGSLSSAFGIVSDGGGGGGGAGVEVDDIGRNGSSGGGGGSRNTSGYSVGGQGISNQGHNGGAGRHRNGNTSGMNAGGGGGAGQEGIQGEPTVVGKGGDGIETNIRNGIGEYYAGGGGGGGYGGGYGGNAPGGLGGGGNGGYDIAPGNGEANTGGGGGGNRTGNTTFPLNGSGGSGIVIIRYEVGEL